MYTLAWQIAELMDDYVNKKHPFYGKYELSEDNFSIQALKMITQVFLSLVFFHSSCNFFFCLPFSETITTGNDSKARPTLAQFLGLKILNFEGEQKSEKLSHSV